MLLICLAFTSGFVVASFQPAQLQHEIPELQQKNTGNTALLLRDHLRLFEEAWDLIEADFYGPLPRNRVRVYGAVRGLLETLEDPYTVLVEPVSHQFEQDDLRGSYGGIGVALDRNDKNQVVLSPFRDSPAVQAGIQEGDVLLAIDGVSITPDMDISQDITSRIRGEVGTKVTLTISRGEDTFSVTITRQIIETPSISWRMVEQAPALGYVRISSFTDRTASELKEALDELVSGGVKGLVLDLRDNGGGLLQSSVDVADQFTDDGVVLYEDRKGQEEKRYFASEGGLATEIPLVVLVNQGTASASEIVAGAIQDHERGVLVGETTFGKGSVQLIFDLSDGSSLHITASRWYTPNRHQLDGKGLIPDLFVEADPNSTKDVQLERAIVFLRAQEWNAE
jgi:carboxyl-terminal processing protease